MPRKRRRTRIVFGLVGRRYLITKEVYCLFTKLAFFYIECHTVLVQSLQNLVKKLLVFFLRFQRREVYRQ